MAEMITKESLIGKYTNYLNNVKKNYSDLLEKNLLNDKECAEYDNEIQLIAEFIQDLKKL